MATTSFRRCLWLINTVRTFGPISFEDISRRWENSALNDSGEPLAKKTFHNHCDAIAEMFDIIIACERKGGYKYYIDLDIDKDAWTASMIDTLCMQAAIANDPDMKNRLIDYNTRFALTEQKNINIVLDAIQNKLPLSFKWRIRIDVEDFYPMYLIKVLQRWFVIGAFHNYPKPQIVPADLMWMTELKTDRDAPRASCPEFDMDEYLAFITEKKDNVTFGKYYTDDILKDWCSDTESEMKELISDAYIHHLANLEFFNIIPKGRSIHELESYYQEKFEPSELKGLYDDCLSDEDLQRSHKKIIIH